MKIGIRGKMVTLLVSVALAPLIVAMLTISLGIRRMALGSFGEMMLLAARAEAEGLAAQLISEVEKLQVAVAEEPSVIAELAGPVRALSARELEALDANWTKMPPTWGPMEAVLNHPVSERLKRLQREDPRLAEVMVTDRHGQLVAASGRTSDYYQADEDWWSQAYADGQGRIFISPIIYDHSAGAWCIDLCLPILDAGQTAGVVKGSLDISRWVRLSRDVGRRQAWLMIVRDDGTIVSRRDTIPLIRREGNWTGEIATGAASGWRTTPNGQIQGYAPLRLPRRIEAMDVVGPPLVLVAYISEAEALGEVRRLSALALAVGLTAIFALFLVGLLLIDRSLVWRVLHLGRAARRVTAGDLAHRLRPGWAGRRLLGPDEIDDLADDFNRMIQRIETSHGELREANELKMNFIQIASHELRTPVSYVLGMVRLLEGVGDADRLGRALRAVGDKAERLNEIIEAMFKVMPRQRYQEQVHYADVVLREVLERVRTDCLPFLQHRRQELVIDAAESPSLVQADPDMLLDMVENLLMNAIKFTPDEGVITIQVVWEVGGWVAVSVQDQGPGVPTHELPHIFQPFYAGADVWRHSTGKAGHGKRGMGLGLTVVKRFAELHGGTVRVATGPSGATFTISIPVEAPPSAGRPEEPRRTPP